jgi:hypothetical protein
MLAHRGDFIVYFNRHTDAPRVWCIATPDRSWEICVASIDLRVPVGTVYKPVPHVAEHHGPPSAYLAGTGAVTVDMKGHAIISEDSGG